GLGRGGWRWRGFGIGSPTHQHDDGDQGGRDEQGNDSLGEVHRGLPFRLMRGWTQRFRRWHPAIFSREAQADPRVARGRAPAGEDATTASWPNDTRGGWFQP